MSIGLQSYPELYTTLLGWSLYGKLWTLLSETGIAYLPFISIILKNVGRSYVSHGHHGAASSLRDMEVNIVTMLLLIFFGTVPFLPLDAHTLSYSPICGSDKDNTYYPGATGTTYDNAFSIPNDGDVRVPLIWYAVISISEGLTNSANSFVGCVPDLRKMVTEVNMAQVTDPAIKNQLQDFEAMCFVPARTQYFNDLKSNKTENLNRIQEDVKKYGADDTDWVGSHAFADVYYRNLKATQPVPGFPYDSNDDINGDINKANPPAAGTPSCYDWWTNSDQGLKSRLYTTLPHTFNAEFGSYIKTDKDQDDVIKNIISHEPNYDNANNTVSDYGFSHLAAAAGIWYHQIEAYPKLYAASQAAPIIQALLLYMTYVFLPFMMVFSGYNPKSYVLTAFIIFSIIFWSFIWRLISWTDKALMQALYSSWFEKQGAGATLTDLIIGGLVIFAPLAWIWLMGAVGISAGDAGSSLMGMNKIGETAAAKGVGMAETGAKMIGKMYLKN